MKINIDVLRAYIDLPADVEALHELMEDTGLEVKRAETASGGPVFTLELLANRGDHHCYAGIAREIHGRTGWALSLPDVAAAEARVSTEKAEVQTDGCMNYVLAELVRDGAEKETPDVLGARGVAMLETSGTNLVTPPVDITNFVNLEIGQPLHAFDADKVKGKVCVRDAVAGETAHLLFAASRVDVPAGTMVIADDEKILAIAGVMGCDDSKPDDTTQRIYLESATFDPVRVRKAARHFGIQSQSSMRFERGADPSLAVGGAVRAISFLTSAGWRMQGGLQLAKTWDAPVARLEISVGRVNDYFETGLSAGDVTQILSRYGFGVAQSEVSDALVVTVPPHRMWDVTALGDVYEEIARGIGYNALPSVLPAGVVGVQPQESLNRREKVEDLFVGEGFYEVFTDGFYGDAQRKKLCADENAPLWRHVQVVNAGDKSFSLLKNNTLVQAMDLVAANVNVRNPHIKAYEWTRTFHPHAAAENGLCDERLVLWAVASGAVRTPHWQARPAEVDAFYMKGLVAELANLLDLQLDVRASVSDDDVPPVGVYLHPGRRAGIYYDGVLVGVIGEVHPDVIAAWGIKSGRPCFLELSQDILDAAPAARRYVAPSNLLTVNRDVCLVLPRGLCAGDVAACMQAASGWIGAVKVSDVFVPDAAQDSSAVTFSLEYDPLAAQKTGFTGDEINGETERVVGVALETYKSRNITRR